MIEDWMVWVIGTCMFAAGCGVGMWHGFVRGQQQAKTWLDHVLATRTQANVAAEHANTASAHANAAQDLKDKRTAAYYASRRGQEPTPKQNSRARDRADQMVNHDDH